MDADVDEALEESLASKDEVEAVVESVMAVLVRLTNLEHNPFRIPRIRTGMTTEEMDATARMRAYVRAVTKVLLVDGGAAGTKGAAAAYESMRDMVCGGRTQAGKTTFVMIAILVAQHVVPKHVRGRLRSRVDAGERRPHRAIAVGDSRVRLHVADQRHHQDGRLYAPRRGRPLGKFDREVRAHLVRRRGRVTPRRAAGGVFVLHGHHVNMDDANAQLAMTKLPFLLLIDEADVFMHSSTEREQLMEALPKYKQAVARLSGDPRASLYRTEGTRKPQHNAPPLRIFISATVRPVYESIVREGRTLPHDCLHVIDPVRSAEDTDYVFLEQMMPYMRDGVPLFLPAAFNAGSGYELVEEVLTFYAAAVAESADSPTPSLIIDITTPFVTRGARLTLAARGRALRERFPTLGIVLFRGRQPTSSAVSYLGVGADRYVDWTDTLQRLIDAEHWGTAPIAVLGYTVMKRGVSIRGDTRTPTHIVVSLGKLCRRAARAGDWPRDARGALKDAQRARARAAGAADGARLQGGEALRSDDGRDPRRLFRAQPRHARGARAQPSLHLRRSLYGN